MKGSAPADAATGGQKPSSGGKARKKARAPFGATTTLPAGTAGQQTRALNVFDSFLESIDKKIDDVQDIWKRTHDAQVAGAGHADLLFFFFFTLFPKFRKTAA